MSRRPGRPIDVQLQERRRAEILDQAAKLFAARGYASTDTQELAAELNVSKGTIFRYFPTKRELFSAAIERSLERLRLAVDHAADAVDDPLEKIIAAMTAYLRFFDDHPEVVELLILERAEFKDRISSYFDRRDRGAECDEHWRQLLTGLIEAGRLRELPVDHIRQVLGDLLYGTIFSNHMSGRTRPFAEQATALFDIVFHGLFTERERQRTAPVSLDTHDTHSPYESQAEQLV